MIVENSSLTAVRSTPKGRGVFATRPIPKGTPVVVGHPTAESEQRTRYTLQMNYDRHVDLDEPGRLINHSCNPSTFPQDNEFGGYTFVARRDIAESEEITFDYDTTEFFSIAVSECLCGSTECRGRTRGFFYLPENKRAEYGRQIGAYAQRWCPTETCRAKDSGDSGMNGKPAGSSETNTSLSLRYATSDTQVGAVDSFAIALYRLWESAATHLSSSQNLKILDINPGPSLVSMWPLAPRASEVVCADDNPTRMGPLMQWQEADPSLKNTAPQAANWTPFVTLAALTREVSDPTPQDLKAQELHMRQVLKFADLNTLEAQDFDLITLSDAKSLGRSDMMAWVEGVKGLMHRLKPNGALLVTVLHQPNQDASVSSFPEMTSGNCREALMSLGLRLTFEGSTEDSALMTVDSLKATVFLATHCGF